MLKTKKYILIILGFFLFTIPVAFFTNDLGAKDMIEGIEFKGKIKEVNVCYKNYLCVELKNDTIRLSSFSCTEGDDIIIGDSVVKMKSNLHFSLFRKNHLGKFEYKADYSRW